MKTDGTEFVSQEVTGTAPCPAPPLRPMNKPYSEACDENKVPILAVIGPLFKDARTLLEIGTGTGQHAAFFAAALPGLTWQTSDIPAHLPGIRLWLDEARLTNLPPPLACYIVYYKAYYHSIVES